MTVGGLVLDRMRFRAAATERALIHLLDYVRKRNGIEFPWEITQAGMAQVLRTRRSHVSITLSSLRTRGYVEDRLGRVVNGIRRRRVYFLTHKGYARAMLLRGQYLKKRIRLHQNGYLQTMRIEELNGVLGEIHTLAEILSCISDTGVLDPRKLTEKAVEDETQEPLMEHERSIKTDSRGAIALYLLLIA